MKKQTVRGKRLGKKRPMRILALLMALLLAGIPIIVMGNDTPEESPDLVMESDGIDSLAASEGSSPVDRLQGLTDNPLSGSINPLASGLIGNLHVTMVDENGVVDFTGSSTQAHMDYSTLVASKNYDVKVELTGMPTDRGKQLEVTLPIGMAWVVDGAAPGSTVWSMISTVDFAGTIPASDKGHTFRGGTKTYHINNTTEALVLNLVVAADIAVYTDQIINAVQVTLTDEHNTETLSETLETLHIAQNKVAVFFRGTAMSHSDMVSVDTAFWYANGDNRRFNMGLQGNGGFARIISSATITYHVDSQTHSANSVTADHVSMGIVGGSSGWSLDSSDSTNGNYTYNYSGGASEGYIIPWQITALGTGNWTAGDRIDIGVTQATVTYAQYPGATCVSDPVTANISERANILSMLYCASADEHVYTGYISPIAAGQNTSNFYSMTQELSALKEETGTLGIFYAGNNGGADSNPKTLEMHFDSDAYGVMALDLPLSQGTAVSSIDVKTTKNSTWQTKAVSLTGGYYNQVYISYMTLGLERHEYITDIRYDCGVIPKVTGLGRAQDSLFYNAYYGVWIDESLSGDSTIRIYDTTSGSGNYDTGISTMTSTCANAYAGINLTYDIANATVVAGSTLSFSAKIGGRSSQAGRNASTENPIIILRIGATDENGEPLKISNLGLRNGANRGDVDLMAAYIKNDPDFKPDGKVVTSVMDGKKYRIITIDTKAVPDGLACLVDNYISPFDGNLEIATLNVSFEIASPALAPGYTQNYGNMFYVCDPLATTGYYTGFANSGVHVTDADLLSELVGAGYPGIVVGLAVPQANSYYKITERAMVENLTQIKHKNDSAYSNYVPGDALTTVGISLDSEADVRAQIVNRAGTVVTGTDVFIPIPKVGEVWGLMSAGFSGAQTAASLILKRAPSSMNSVGVTYDVTYVENAAPTGNGAALQALSWVDAASVADWGAVNCVRISVSHLPVNGDLEIVFPLAVDEHSPGLVNGLVSAWRSYYYQNLTNSKGDQFIGWYSGEPVAVSTALDGVQGQLFSDTNNNGVLDVGEPMAAQWDIGVYEKSDLTTPVQQIKTAADGSYKVVDLLDGADRYVLKVINPSPATLMFARVGSGVAGNKFASADAGATGIAKASPLVVNALGVMPAAATYNVGIVPLAATTLSWRLQSGMAGMGSISAEIDLSGYHYEQISSKGALPMATAASGYEFKGWALSDAGDAVIPAFSGISAFGAGDGNFGYDTRTYYAVFAPIGTGGNNPYDEHADGNVLGTGDSSLPLLYAIGMCIGLAMFVHGVRAYRRYVRKPIAAARSIR